MLSRDTVIQALIVLLDDASDDECVCGGEEAPGLCRACLRNSVIDRIYNEDREAWRAAERARGR